jgi:hypothetical protein
MAITAGIGAATSIAGGLLGAGAAKKAAGQQSAALQNALDFQQQVYGTDQTNLNPFIGAGTNALASLSQLYGLPAPAGTNMPAGNALNAYNAFTQTPFYQFPLSQGISALNRSGAAQGLTLSGGQANALQKYGQGYASSNFNSYINALSGLANLGQSSATSLGSLGNQAAGTVLTGQTALGNAQASGTIGAQNQINNALSAIPLLLGGGGGSSYGGSGSGSGGGGLVNALSGLFGGGSTVGTTGGTSFAPALSPGQTYVGGFTAQ